MTKGGAMPRNEEKEVASQRREGGPSNDASKDEKGGTTRNEEKGSLEITKKGSLAMTRRRVSQ
jgi:hypothetical protein